MPPVGPHRRTHQRTPALTRDPSADSSSDSSTSTTNTVVSGSQSVTRPTRNHDQGAGYFEPSLTTASQVAAATAVARESARKHSQSDPSPPTTAMISPMPMSAAGAAALAAMPKLDRGVSSGNEKEKEKEKKESKMKIFSKPLRAAQSAQAMRHAESKPLPSPSKLSHMATPLPRIPSSVSSSDGSRRPSFTSTISDTLYSSSPPTSSHSHKHHLLLRSRKEQPLSSANSNSKLVGDGSSIYNFNPNSPSSASFPVSVSVNSSQKTLVTNADIKHVVGVSGKDKDAVGEQVLEEVWPLLRARVLPLFAGEGLRIPVEDLNKLVIVHIKRQVEKKAAILLIDDVRTLLDQGMCMLDNSSLSKMTDVRLIPRLVEIWNFVLGTVLPYFEAVFLPLQQEFKGIGSVLTAREARDAWGITDQRLDIRRMTLISYRDSVILPLYSRLHAIFSKLQLDFDALPNVTETVGRVLQCVSVLSSLLSNDDKQAKMDELAKTVKHNWLSRGRTGRNRLGFVGTKTRALGSANSLGSSHSFGDLTIAE
ncbi:hypothetical protein ABW19_dt0208755 [Dactylella cylindrospora]|nr:hypothetical protein ABW19_dt0208755 [Dactylella cylindrospora]